MRRSSAVILNFRILQGSVATKLRWDGRPATVTQRVSLGIC